MNGKLLKWAGCLATALALTACSSEDPSDSTRLPDGKYPVTITATGLEAAATSQTAQAAATSLSRTTTEGEWETTDAVAVEISSRVLKYRPGSKGATVTLAAADESFYWESTSRPLAVRAWYFGSGYMSSLPNSWQVNTNQGSVGGNKGYQQSDFLYAYGSLSFNGSNALTFYHQTARVVVNILKAGAVGDATAVDVVLGDHSVACEADFTAPTDGATFGTWSIDSSAHLAQISMNDIGLPDGRSDVKQRLAALVIPQDMSGKRLFAVTIQGIGTHYFVPKTGEANFTSGTEYTYDITVKRDGLEVSASTSGEWTDGGSQDVTSEKVTLYSAADLKPGDYYYSDGTWSDGGLRKRYSRGGQEWAAEKPAPEEGKTVIAIVFQTDPARMGTAEKEALANLGVTPHGLAVATKAATSVNSGFMWFNCPLTQEYDRDETEIGIPNTWVEGDVVATYNLVNADIEGYARNAAIRTQRTEEYNNYKDYGNGYYGNLDNSKYCYPAFKVAEIFGEAVPPPSKTTGWYLPSAGQWFDILRELCKISLKIEAADRFDSNNGGWTGKGNVPALMNAAMEYVPTDQKTDYADGSFFWISSAASSSKAYLIYITQSGDVRAFARNKKSLAPIRYVLAF